MGISVSKITEFLFSFFLIFSNNELTKTNSKTILHLDDDNDVIIKKCIHDKKNEVNKKD